MSGVTASVSPNPLSFLSIRPKIGRDSSPPLAVFRCRTSSSNLKLKGIRYFGSNGSPRFDVSCRSSSGPGGPASGENESRTVLDAFFLGKALAEALTERIESTIGEVLSGIGRLQAEQQKQILDLQEEVIERAKKAKEKAAREAIKVQGIGSISPSIISPTDAVTLSPTTKHEIEAATNQPSSKPDTESEPAIASGEE